MDANNYLWILIVLLGLCSRNNSKVNNSCQTPNSTPGECKAVTECPPILNILSNRPITPENADFLSRSQCNHHGKAVKVCCPLQVGLKMPGKDIQLLLKNLTDVGEVTSDLLPQECGLDLQDKVVGGKKAGLGEFPWMALIEYEKTDGNKTFVCGGVLISRRYVLTAAHCIKRKYLPRTWKMTSVRLGENNLQNETDWEDKGYTIVRAPPAINVPVEEKIVHEHFNTRDVNQYHDVALLRLAQDVKFTNFIRPICLPLSTDRRSENLTGKLLTVAGWGVTETNKTSDDLLKVSLPVKANEECDSDVLNLKAAQLCVGGEKGKDSCARDSGGPLMQYTGDDNGDFSWVSVGIVSLGYTPCGMEGYPAVYTKVSNYMPWIVSKLRP